MIVDGSDETRALELAEIAEQEHAAVLQLRDKTSPYEAMVRIGKMLRSILHDTIFIVNDDPEIARAVGAEGVHLGQEDMPIDKARTILGPNAIIGISTSSTEQALIAEQAEANYLGFGHMFPTRSKEKASRPRTRDELSAVIATVSIPVIAIGGIKEENVSEILIPGLGGIAVISAISTASKPRTTVRNFVRKLEEHRVTYA